LSGCARTRSYWQYRTSPRSPIRRIDPENGPYQHVPQHNSAVGLILHDTMAFTTEGAPLGLLNVQCWGRDPEQVGTKQRRHQLPIEEKESVKWLVS
jgi:hypothetical protein